MTVNTDRTGLDITYNFKAWSEVLAIEARDHKTSLRELITSTLDVEGEFSATIQVVKCLDK